MSHFLVIGVTLKTTREWLSEFFILEIGGNLVYTIASSAFLAVGGAAGGLVLMTKLVGRMASYHQFTNQAFLWSTFLIGAAFGSVVPIWAVRLVTNVKRRLHQRGLARVAAAERAPRVEGAFQKTLRAGKLILEGGVADGAPRKNIRESRTTWIVLDDYSGQVVDENVIEAIAPFHFWEYRFASESTAPAQEFLEDIDFHVKVDRGDIAYLLCGHTWGPRTKRVALLFLPFLNVGDVRRVTVTYRWPSFFAGLRPADAPPLVDCTRPDGIETFAMDYRGSRDALQTAECLIYYAPTIGYLGAESNGVHLPGDRERLVAAPPHPDFPGFPGHAYLLRDAPPQEYEVTLARLDGRVRR